MYKYIQKILHKVSFDKDLFRKELTKATKILKYSELMALKVWCLAQFGGEYQEIITEVFRNVSETIRNVS